MADDRVTYTVIVDYTQNNESDEQYAELKAEVKSKIAHVQASKGTSEAQLVSIAEA